MGIAPMTSCLRQASTIHHRIKDFMAEKWWILGISQGLLTNNDFLLS